MVKRPPRAVRRRPEEPGVEAGGHRLGSDIYETAEWMIKIAAGLLVTVFAWLELRGESRFRSRA